MAPSCSSDRTPNGLSQRDLVSTRAPPGRHPLRGAAVSYLPPRSSTSNRRVSEIMYLATTGARSPSDRISSGPVPVSPSMVALTWQETANHSEYVKPTGRRQVFRSAFSPMAEGQGFEPRLTDSEEFDGKSRNSAKNAKS